MKLKVFSLITILASISASQAATIALNGLNTTGDGSAGWQFANAGPNTDIAGDDWFYHRAQANTSLTANFLRGTTSGFSLAAGTYTIGFDFRNYNGATLNQEVLTVYAWNGSTERMLGIYFFTFSENTPIAPH